MSLSPFARILGIEARARLGIHIASQTVVRGYSPAFFLLYGTVAQYAPSSVRIMLGCRTQAIGDSTTLQACHPARSSARCCGAQ